MKSSIFGIFAVSCLVVLSGCGNSDDGDQMLVTGNTLGVKISVSAQLNGNIEAVKTFDWKSPAAAVVGSKERKIHYISYQEQTNTLEEFYNVADDPFNNNTKQTSESEYTNLAIMQSQYTDEKQSILGFVTRTELLYDASEKLIGCDGGLIAMDYRASGSKEAKMTVSGVSVGSMPDAVAVSGDKRYILTADEHDSADTWGKCTVASYLPSVTIIDLMDAPKDDTAFDFERNITNPAKQMKQVFFTKKGVGGAPREPEYIAFSSDHRTVAVTLQDSHEVALFNVADVMKIEGEKINAEDHGDIIRIVSLEKNDAGYDVWPDGIVGFHAQNKDYFAMAGEGNDTIEIIDQQGNHVSRIAITESDVPPTYPCLKADDFATVKYSPDSITSFQLNARVYVAATLRYAGAVIVYDVTTPTQPTFEWIARAGENDIVNDGVCKDYSSMTRVYPEGIAANVVRDDLNHENAYIWIANEGNNTVTMMRVEALANSNP